MKAQVRTSFTARTVGKIDEAHGYKNLRTPSNIPDAAIDGSMRASDLDMKISYLRRAQRQAGGHLRHRHAHRQQHHRSVRHAALPAARPAGSRRDRRLRHLGRHLRPKPSTRSRLAPEGGNSFRQKTRFARFTNVPEMLRCWHVSADIKTADDLKLPVPALAQRPADGQRVPETVIVQPTDEQLE